VKSQTATEYLVITAVVIIIALIVVGVLGGIPGLGSITGDRAQRAELATLQLGITDYAITEEKTIFTINNNMQRRASIDRISIGSILCNAPAFVLSPSQSRTVECTNIDSTVESRFTIAIEWTDTQTGLSYTQGGGNNQDLFQTPPFWCLQEFADQSNSCGGLGTGSYTCNGDWSGGFPCSNVYDNNYNTYGAAASFANLEILYDIPAGATIASQWQVKIGNLAVTTNQTLPQDCWNQDPLRLRLLSDIQIFESFLNLAQCYDGSSWVTVYSGGVNQERIYEESMWWYIEP